MMIRLPSTLHTILGDELDSDISPLRPSHPMNILIIIKTGRAEILREEGCDGSRPRSGSCYL